MAKTSKIPCSVEILTLNSAKTLERCLLSLGLFDDILVLDGNSTDDTIKIAERFGARVIPQTDTNESDVPITDFAAVRNRGLKQAKHPWFLYIDSDEYLSPEAVEEIRGVVAEPPGPYSAYRLPRYYVVDGQVIGRASVYPNYQTRLAYRPDVLGFTRQVHESLRLCDGARVGTLQHGEYVPIERKAELKQKWAKYLDIQAAMYPNISFSRLLKSIRGNFLKFAAYTVRYLLTFVRGQGKRMPFWFEYYNAVYYPRLLWRLFKNFVRKF